MARSSAGLIFIIAGGALIMIGLLIWAGGFSWFGRLPGDIRVERPNLQIYFPITSMLLVSIVLSVLATIVARLR